MSQTHALIVDDEPDIRELLTITLARMGTETTTAANLAEAKQRLTQSSYDLCLTDLKLPDGDGLELVGFIQDHCPDMPVAVITAYGSMETAIEALKTGAFDFVCKPVDLTILRKLVQTALKLSGQNKSHTTNDEIETTGGLLGNSQAIIQLRQQISKLARSQAPVLIHGQSGTGKELAARLIHEQGPRSDKPFIPVNCGAIPTELMESEFFGHEKGSFTGAEQKKQGLFQAADGGTLFLDEIADLPLPMQVKLLRAIQEKAVRPVGSSKEQSVDIRIVSASHKDLKNLVDKGEFRQDLFYRINVIMLDVPSLHERQDDIALLADAFLQRYADELNISAPSLSEAALQALLQYPFPGNIRELENIIERALTMCESKQIRAQDLQLPSAGDPAAGATNNLEQHLSDIEKAAIHDALAKTKGNKTAAAKLLGISFRALRYRLEKLGIE